MMCFSVVQLIVYCFWNKSYMQGKLLFYILMLEMQITNLTVTEQIDFVLCNLFGFVFLRGLNYA
jgi:hypothetical protein